MEELKLICAGGRKFDNAALVAQAINELSDTIYKKRAISIVSGMAWGADILGYEFAKKHNIKAYQFPANWSKNGKGAGFMRNKEMGDFSDALLAFWDGESPGTKQMIAYMQSLSKPTYIVRY